MDVQQLGPSPVSAHSEGTALGGPRRAASGARLALGSVGFGVSRTAGHSSGVGFLSE